MQKTFKLDRVDSNSLSTAWAYLTLGVGLMYGTTTAFSLLLGEQYALAFAAFIGFPIITAFMAYIGMQISCFFLNGALEANPVRLLFTVEEAAAFETKPESPTENLVPAIVCKECGLALESETDTCPACTSSPK
jgi:hypothetical protein